MIENLIIYVLGFALIWFGAGLIVSSTTKFSQRLRVSPFAFSFVFLGILTSTPEFSVGLTAVSEHKPEIFVGNLLGGIVVLFLVIIPLLAIFGNGIKLNHKLDKKTLIITLLAIAAPSILILDRNVTNLEGIILILIYLAPLIFIERNGGIFDRSNENLLNTRSYSYKDILKVIFGLGIVFVASQLIVDKTIFFANFLNIPAFYISLIIIALGTDLPEISLAIRAVIYGKKEIALGDYIGAAAASTLLFGIFTILNNGEVVTISNFLVTFIFIIFAVSSFYFFSITKNYISRRSGIVLFSAYIVFVFLELSL